MFLCRSISPETRQQIENRKQLLLQDARNKKKPSIDVDSTGEPKNKKQAVCVDYIKTSDLQRHLSGDKMIKVKFLFIFYSII